MNAGPALSSAVAPLHVLRLTRAKRRTPWAVECASLPEADVAAIREAVGNRDAIKIAHSVEKVRRARNLPGLVLLCGSPQRALVVPAPLVHPFEPVPLGDGRCDDLFQSLLAGQSALDEAQQGKLAALQRAQRRSRWYLGAFVNGWAGFCLLRIVLGGLPSTRDVLSFSMIMIGALFLLMGVMFRSTSWLLASQGAFVRRSRIFRPASYEFRPGADATTVIESRSDGCTVCLARRESWGLLELSAIECTALLAAWQSPVPPPSVGDVQNLA
jgi:hypothetical protein